ALQMVRTPASEPHENADRGNSDREQDESRALPCDVALELHLAVQAAGPTAELFRPALPDRRIWKSARPVAAEIMKSAMNTKSCSLASLIMRNITVVTPLCQEPASASVVRRTRRIDGEMSPDAGMAGRSSARRLDARRAQRSL
ncbi:MAG TPA: hypothetical protein VFR21_13045, partial [Bradyrhizobium sp.]|nr:hypothetical protein [Bradyrhizobium sp.]